MQAKSVLDDVEHSCGEEKAVHRYLIKIVRSKYAKHGSIVSYKIEVHLHQAHMVQGLLREIWRPARRGDLSDVR